MRRTAAIYPFCAELLSIVKVFDELQTEYRLTKLISPKGLSLCGKDAGHSCKQEDTGINVSDETNMHDPDWEVLLIAKISGNITLESEEIETIVFSALQAGKIVRYFGNSEAEISPSVANMQIQNTQKLFLDFDGLHQAPNVAVDIKSKKFSAPIIFVGGLIGEEDTFSVLVLLARKLKRENLSVLVITRQAIGRLFEFNTLTHIIDSKDLSENEKIQLANNLVYHMAFEKMPDVILVEAPDAVMKYNDSCPNGYGIKSYMMCQALPPDYFVCCMPCDMAFGAFINKINQDFSVRLGVEISVAHISNLAVDFIDATQTHEISAVRLDMDYVKEQIEKEKNKSDIPMLNINLDGIDALYDAILCDNKE